MPKKITLGKAQEAIAGRIKSSLKKPTKEEIDYQRVQTIHMLIDNYRLLECKKAALEKLVAELIMEKRRLQERIFRTDTDINFQIKELAAMRKEIFSLRKEKDAAVEKVFELGADCRCKDDLNATLAGKNQDFLDKILWTNAQLGLLEHAYIDQWMAEKTFKALVGRKPKNVPLKDINELLDSLRKNIDKMGKELMAGITLSE